MQKPMPLRWHGGKSGYGKAEWIASLLPWERDTTYIETHAGMLGVLLAREPVKCELVNDLDERVINWWRVVRDQREEFGRLVEATPHSRREYEWAQAAVADLDLPAIKRALAFHILILQGAFARQQSGAWRRGLSPSVGSLSRWRSERVAALAERMWNVQLECRDALDLLEQVAKRDYTVIYIDPPYRDGSKAAYRKGKDGVDVERMAGLLLAQRGRVAISGYDDEWDRLGWRREERTWREGANLHKPRERTEVLWMNYDGAADGC